MIDQSYPVLEIKALTEEGSLAGYGAIFDNVDYQNDRIERGAFAKSLEHHKAHRSMPAMLWQHDEFQPIGKWTDMKEDNKGLYCEGRLNLNVLRGREAYEHVKAGDIAGLSIGYVPGEVAYDTVKQARILKSFKVLGEVSLVTMGANPEANIESIKSAIADMRLEEEGMAEKARHWDGWSDLLERIANGETWESHELNDVCRRAGLSKSRSTQLVAKLIPALRSNSVGNHALDDLSAAISNLQRR